MVASSAYAQMPQGGQRPERPQFSPENMAKMQTEQMAQTLKLSDAQLQAVYELNLANAIEQVKQMEEQRKRQQAREAATDEAMKKILADIQDGTFAKDFLLDMSDAGSQVHFNAMRKIASEHPSEVVGKEIRKLYSWSDEDKLINN